MNRIKELRLKNGWLQSDLSERLNTKPQTVSRYEKGDRGLDVETIDKLCDIFDVTSDYLLGRSAVPRYDFTADELAVLSAYRRLSPTGQEYVRHTLALAELAHSEKNGAVPDVEIAN